MTNIIFTFFVKSERSISRQITSVATCVKHENHWKWTIKGKQPLLFRPKRVIQKLFVRMKKNAGSVPKKKKWTKGSTIITHLRTIQLWSMLETLLKTLNINSSDCMVMKPFDRGVILFFCYYYYWRIPPQSFSEAPQRKQDLSDQIPLRLRKLNQHIKLG